MEDLSPACIVDTGPTLSAGLNLVERRLAVLPTLLRRADRKWKESDEHVHRLRVATRRADAALTAFRPLFDPHRFKQIRRRIRAIREAAQDARDCDVHIAMLQSRLAKERRTSRRSIAEAIRRTQHERIRAQKAIARIAARYPAPRINGWTARLIDSAETDAAEGLEKIEGHLAKRARVVRSATEADLAVPKNLHSLRLAAKKLRYAVEIFGPYRELPLRSRVVPGIKETGDRLGAIVDAQDLALRLRRLARQNKEPRRTTDGLGSLANTWRSESEIARSAFLEWWKEHGAHDTVDRLESWSQPASAVR